MVEEIRLTPRDGVLAVDVKGNLAAMLAAASPNEDWQRQTALVAGGAPPLAFGGVVGGCLTRVRQSTLQVRDP